MATIDEYFARNGIVAKPFTGRTPEQRKAMVIREEKAYYDAFFRTELYKFKMHVDYPANKMFFMKLLEEAKKFQDILEPCCQAGTLGCFLALESGAEYQGIDLNEVGIEMARERAVEFGLPPKIFQVADFLAYEGHHEAVVGKYVVEALNNTPRDEMIEAIGRVTKNAVLMQTAQERWVKRGIEMHKAAFERHGFKYEVLTEHKKAISTGGYDYIAKATKR